MSVSAFQFCCHWEVGEWRGRLGEMSVLCIHQWLFSHQICNLKAADKQHHTKCFLISIGNCIFFSGITFLQAAAYLSEPHIMSTVSFSALDLLLLF